MTASPWRKRYAGLKPGNCCSSSITNLALGDSGYPGLMAAIKRSILPRWLSCSVMYLINSGMPICAAMAMTIGTMPPIRNRICQPYCGTSAAVTKPGMAPPIGTHPTAIIASGRAQFARRGTFGVDGDDIRDNTADTQARQQTQPEHLIEIGRIGRGKRENAGTAGSTRPALPYGRSGRRSSANGAEPKQNANKACAEHRSERAGFQGPFPDRGLALRRRLPRCRSHR